MIIYDLHIFGPFFPVENWALGQVLFFPVATAFVSLQVLALLPTFAALSNDEWWEVPVSEPSTNEKISGGCMKGYPKNSTHMSSYIQINCGCCGAPIGPFPPNLAQRVKFKADAQAQRLNIDL